MLSPTPCPERSACRSLTPIRISRTRRSSPVFSSRNGPHTRFDCGWSTSVCSCFSSRRRHTRFDCDWSSDVCSSDLPSWLPVWVICENCGRIGTTHATDFDGATVAFECRKDYVSWAEGCGHRGRLSPFKGDRKSVV